MPSPIRKPLNNLASTACSVGGAAPLAYGSASTSRTKFAQLTGIRPMHKRKRGQIPTAVPNLACIARSVDGHMPRLFRKPPDNLVSIAHSVVGRRPINRKRGISPLASKGICLFSALRGLLHYNIYDFLWYVDFFDYVAGEFICDCSFSGF